MSSAAIGTNNLSVEIGNAIAAEHAQSTHSLFLLKIGGWIFGQINPTVVGQLLMHDAGYAGRRLCGIQRFG